MVYCRKSPNKLRVCEWSTELLQNFYFYALVADYDRRNAEEFTKNGEKAN
jgi:hypothetical protein